jgi:beta-glucanase (GH16 family)
MSILYTLLATVVVGQSSPSAGRKLVFSCDFTRTHKLSAKDWKFNDGPVYNNELEKYASGLGQNAFFTKEGLVIQALKVDGKVTSTRLESQKSWKYGYFEFEAKVPAGKGTWPAIWMLNDRLRNPGKEESVGWPKCGEIDIMENVGYDSKNFHYSLHSDKYNWQRKEQRTAVVSSDHPLEFHKFGLDWKPDSITFYMDGKEGYRVVKDDDSFGAWPFRDPFYIILNLAIGGSWGGAQGVDDTIFPSQFVIKYVKVYQ